MKLKFGIQWRTISGNRAFLWNVSHGCKGPVAEGVIFDDALGVWRGSIWADQACVMNNLISDFPPNIEQLKPAIAEECARKIDAL